MCVRVWRPGEPTRRNPNGTATGATWPTRTSRSASSWRHQLGVPMTFTEAAFKDFSEAIERDRADGDARLPMQLQNERAGVSIKLTAEQVKQTLAHKNPSPNTSQFQKEIDMSTNTQEIGRKIMNELMGGRVRRGQGQEAQQTSTPSCSTTPRRSASGAAWARPYRPQAAQHPQHRLADGAEPSDPARAATSMARSPMAARSRRSARSCCTRRSTAACRPPARLFASPRKCCASANSSAEVKRQATWQRTVSVHKPSPRPRRLLVKAAAALASLLATELPLAGEAAAQAFPSKPVRVSCLPPRAATWTT